MSHLGGAEENVEIPARHCDIWWYFCVIVKPTVSPPLKSVLEISQKLLQCSTKQSVRDYKPPPKLMIVIRIQIMIRIISKI